MNITGSTVNDVFTPEPANSINIHIEPEEEHVHPHAHSFSLSACQLVKSVIGHILRFTLGVSQEFN